jgi:hypothetical protein
LQPDLFFELNVRRMEKKLNQSGFPANRQAAAGGVSA